MDKTLAAFEVVFAGEGRGDAPDSLVERAGKIFELGHWPDKADFRLDEEGADAAATSFAGAPLELEHFASQGRASIFDGKLGDLVAIERRGRDLWGRVRLPAFVDRCWEQHGRKISVVWDTARQQIVRAGLVLHPRISDAALGVAFAEFSLDPDQASFAGRRHNATDQDLIQRAHDSIVRAGADCQTMYTANNEETTMTENTQVTTPPPATTGQPLTTTTSSAAGGQVTFTDPRVEELQRALQQANDRASRLEASNRAREAQATVDGWVYDGKIAPSEKDGYIALFAQALADDAITPGEIAFSTGQKLSRAAALKALVDARPRTPMLGDASSVIFSNQASDGKDDPLSVESVDTFVRQWGAKHNVRKG